MPSSILQIVLKVTKEGSGNKELAKEAKELKASLSDLGLGSLATVTALGAVSGAVAGAVAFTKGAIDATVKYAGEVKNLAQITGELPEETSRVIQVMDDFKLTSEDLTKAQKQLAKDGLSLNIETLAKLSDEYKKLNTGAEKTQFLVDKFGKTGLQFADAMEQGGDKLRGLSEEVNKNLVLTADAIKQAEQYRLNVDELSDAWEGFKITVGNGVIPVLNSAIDTGKRWFAAMDEAAAVTGRTDQRSKIFYATIIAQRNAEVEHAKAIAETAEATSAARDGIISLTDANKNSTEATKEAQAAAKAQSDEYRSLLSLTQTLAGAEQSYIETLSGLQAEQAQVAKELANTPWWDTSAIEQHKAKLAEIDGQINETAENYQKKNAEIVYSNLLAKASVGGLTDANFNMMQQAGVALGIFSQAQADSAIKMNELTTAVANGKLAVDDLGAALKMLPNNVPVSVILDILTTGVDTTMGGGRVNVAHGPAVQQRDSGGSGKAGEAYVIGMGAQPEVFIPDTNGSFYPAGSYSVANGASGGQQTVIIKLAGDADKLFQPVIERGVRRMR